MVGVVGLSRECEWLLPPEPEEIVVLLRDLHSIREVVVLPLDVY